MGTGNFECSDFFPVSVTTKSGLDNSAFGENVNHVMKVSLDVTRYEYYTVGTYDRGLDKYIPDENLIDGDGANEYDTTENDVKKGWAGIQLIPRTLVLDPNGRQLLHWPIEEVEKLTINKVQLSNRDLHSEQHIEINGIIPAQADIDVTFTFDNLEKAEPLDPRWDIHDAQKIYGERDSTVQGSLGSFGLITLASDNLEEYTPEFFRIFKSQNQLLVLLCSDVSRSTLTSRKSQMDGRNNAYHPSFGGFVSVDFKDKSLSLRSLIDHSVVESFAAGGKTVVTSRVYHPSNF